MALAETEMPRSRSIFIQSERVRRFSPRARTWPAARIAPPASSRFSVSVVLPASGWEMIAKVRRLAAWAAILRRELEASAAREVVMGGQVACRAPFRKPARSGGVAAQSDKGGH